MAGCTCENWTLQDLASALQDMHKDNKRIVVPMFQRGKRWRKQQEQKFIDSLIKGYPVGTMLFYETYEDGKRTYILVDGLQRGNSIKKYMTNPTEFFYDDSISDEFCSSVLNIVHKEDDKTRYGKIRTLLTDFIKAQKTFKNLQYFLVAKQIADEFSAGFEPIAQLIDVIKDFLKNVRICMTESQALLSLSLFILVMRIICRIFSIESILREHHWISMKCMPLHGQ